MTIRVTTRHCEGFDVLTDRVDPARSPYAQSVSGYVEKITAFYRLLGVESAIWTAEWKPKGFEIHKPVEYLLELGEERVIAYVDEDTWSFYLFGKRDDFIWSRMPAQYKIKSILVALPIRREEVMEFRRYTCTNTGHCRLLETKSGIDLQRILDTNRRTAIWPHRDELGSFDGDVRG